MFHNARMGNALKIMDIIPVVENIFKSVMRNPGVLINLARLKCKDNYTYMHSIAVSALMSALARTLGLSDDQIFQSSIAGLLHDIGKAKSPVELINKHGKLTEPEFNIIKNHPVDGYKILQDSKGIDDIVLIVCMQHHEKLNSCGYPCNLADNQINYFAKMGSICDVYDAITSDRSYKNGWEPAEAIRKMAEWSSSNFDRNIFEAFVKSVGIYPIGTLVRLESHRLGVVIEQTKNSLLTPILIVFFSITGNHRVIPELLDLSKPGCMDRIVSHENPLKWNIQNNHQLWSELVGLPI